MSAELNCPSPSLVQFLHVWSAPSVYAQRAYLQTFARATANARKYVLLTTNTENVIVLDLQDKIRTDLLEGLNPTPTKK